MSAADRHGTQRGRFGRVGLALLVGVACSSLADPPATEECRGDDDCPVDFVCATDQGRCLPGTEAAPRAHLGFDIRERVAGVTLYRVEVAGCDCLVQEAQNIRELSLRRSRVSQQLQLAVTTVADPNTRVAAEFVLTQPSRLGQVPTPLRRRVDQLPTKDPSTDVITELRWPRYHPLDAAPPRELVLWELDPEGAPAPRYQGLKPPTTDRDKPCTVDSDCCEMDDGCDPWPNFCDTDAGECTAIGSPEWTFGYAYDTGCDRDIEGDVVLFDADAPSGAQFTPLPDASVQLRYAAPEPERFGIPVFASQALDERPHECDEDSDCVTPDEYCDPASNQCFVNLAGLPAADSASTSAADTEPGTFRTGVYIYCDGMANTTVERRFGVTVTPPGALATVDYLLDAAFFPFPMNLLRIGDRFCVPDWGAPTTLELQISAAPRNLLGDDAQGYECCDLGCLPQTASDVETVPPTAPETCDGRASAGAASIEVSTDLVLGLEDLVAWEEAGCVTPALDEGARVGGLSRPADCTVEGEPCRAEQLARGTAETPRTYRVRLESPVGSVLASEDFFVDIGPDDPPLATLTPAQRVLVKGTVDVDSAICARRDPGEDCAAREAVVMAERLRMPDEPDDLPGPFLHTVSTFYDPIKGRDGAFVLPLDPGGVYVLTALPSPGAEGGPGNFRVVNLRADANATVDDQRLVLEDGVVVTLLLEQFDQGTSVEPIDRGSYLVEGRRLAHPGREGTADPFIDLNRIGECWGLAEEGPQACKIRRLIPPGSILARSLVGQVRFTARQSDEAECSQQCPQPLSEP